MANIFKENQTIENLKLESHYNSHSDKKNKDLSIFFTKLQTAYSSLANSKKLNFDQIIDQYNVNTINTISKEVLKQPQEEALQTNNKVVETTPNYYSFFDESQIKKVKIV